MKAALEGVRWVAAIMRSPSFSRVGESRTIRKSPLAEKGGVLVFVCIWGRVRVKDVPKAVMQSGIEEN